jgi:DNA polymerase-1
MKFNQFLKELGLTAPDEKANRQIDRSVYQTVLTVEALDRTVADIRAAGRLSFDLETTGLDTLTAKIVGFALAWAPGQAAYVPVAHGYPGAPEQLPKADVLEALRPLLTDPAFPKVGQNVKYEWQVLHRDAGLDYRGVAGDSMLAAYLLDANRRAFNLDELATEYLGHRMLGFQEVTAHTGADGAATPNDGRFGRVDVTTATQYAAEDADVALRLCDTLHPRLSALGLDPLYREIELPLARVLARMELWGIRLDPHDASRPVAKVRRRIGDLELRDPRARRRRRSTSAVRSSSARSSSSAFSCRRARRPRRATARIKPCSRGWRPRTAASSDARVSPPHQTQEHLSRHAARP